MNLSDSWTRFKDVIQKVPNNGLSIWTLIGIFLKHLDSLSCHIINLTAERDLRKFSDIGAYSLSTMDNEVGVTSLESTIQTLPSFEEYTSPVTYPEEVKNTLGTSIKVEPLNETKLEEVGLNCNHNTPFSSSEARLDSVSFSTLLKGDSTRKGLNFRTLIISEGNEADVAVPLESIIVTSERFINTGRSSYARVMIEIRADVVLKDTIVVAMSKLIGEGFYTCTIRVEYEPDVAKNLKKPSQAPRGILVGRKVDFNKLIRRKMHSLEKRKITLVNDEGKPLEKVDNPGDHDSEDEVEPVDNEMASFMTSNKVGYGSNSLLEQWRKTYENADYDYDPYDVICMKAWKFLTIFNLYAIIWISSYEVVRRNRLLEIKRVVHFFKDGGLAVMVVVYGQPVIATTATAEAEWVLVNGEVWRAMSRSGIESEQWDHLLDSLEGVMLNPSEDRWSWDLNGLREFSVASARRYIDNNRLPDISSKTRWIKKVPIKVNVHTWKVLSTWMTFGGNTSDLGSFGEETDEITDLYQILEEVLLTERGDGITSIKRRCRDLFSDGVWNLETASGRGRLKKDLESST
nr:RNA-directed DNA polymerase, eukaryota [Tanacetum cinerariifolium]